MGTETTWRFKSLAVAALFFTTAGMAQDSHAAPPPPPAPAPAIAPSAQELRKIAVYVIGTMFTPEEDVGLEQTVMYTLKKIGRYNVIDRSVETSKMLTAEHSKQRDGSVSDEQIKKLGAQFGVDLICLTVITNFLDAWKLSISIIDIETAEIVDMYEERSIERYKDKLRMALDKVLERMFNDKTAAAQTTEAVNAQGQKLMKAKYDGTEIYATEYFAASGAPVTVVGPNDILTVINEGKNYYKVRTASSKEGFVVKKDLVSGSAQFIDMRRGAPPVTKRDIAEARQRGAAVRDEYAVYDFTVGQRFGTWGVNYFIAGLGSLTIMRDYTGAAIHAGSAVGGIGLMAAGVANNSPELAITGMLSVAGGSVFSIVRSITYHKPGSQPRPSDFTTGERWGTWGLNTAVPGLGSAVFMKDYVGAGVMAGSTIVGTGLIVSGYVGILNDATKTTNPNDVSIKGSDKALILTGMGFTTFSSIWNIIRSASYNHTYYGNAAVNPLGNLNIAVLPDQDGNIKGYLTYGMEF